MTEPHTSEGIQTDFAELWRLILKVANEAGDELIESLRIALFVELARREEQGPRSNARHIAASLWSFRPARAPMSIPPSEKKLPLLLFPYSTGSHMLNMLPVAREAKRRGLLGGIVAGSVNTEELREFNRVTTERALLSLSGARLLPQIIREVWRSFDRLVELLRRYDAQCALRIKRNYGAIIRQMIFSKRMAIAFGQLLSAWKPSCVISTSDDWPFEFQLFCQAKRMGIPNAAIQHGALGGVVSWPNYSDTFLVWGDVFRQKLLGLGALPHRLKVCGMPASDDLFVRYRDAGAKEVNKASPVCLVFSHAHDRGEEPELFNNFAGYLAEAIRSTPRFQWKIKLHPAEDDSFYRERGFINRPRVEVLPKNVSLEQAVEQADVVCTIRSTAGLQAMMMQRPLIIIDLVPNVDCSVWWPLHGGGLAAKTPEAFRVFLDRLIDDSDFKASVLNSQHEFLDRSFANKGRAAASVVDYLEEQTLRYAKSPPVAIRAKKLQIS